MQDPTFDEQVAFLVKLYRGWLINLQINAIADGSVIEPEVLAQAFKELASYYDILSEEPDIDAVIDKMLGDE